MTFVVFPVILLFQLALNFSPMYGKTQETDFEQVAKWLLSDIKNQKINDSLLVLLKNVSPEVLSNQLNSDEKKLGFWINIYNAFVLIKLEQNPEIYKKKNQLYSGKHFIISQKKISLDDIEHGILRKSKNKYSMGYFNNWFPGKFEKMMRVNFVDHRIHFALNCGAASCPPIRFYQSENIDQQLNLATLSYLSQETKYNAKTNIVELPKLMWWFRADFGGRKGILQILKQFEIIPEAANPKFAFKTYNWDLEKGKFE